MHLVARAADRIWRPHPILDRHSRGYRSAPLVNETTGSVHTGLSLNEMAAGGTLDPHVHSYEEGFYILDGLVVVDIDDRAFTLGPGDFGALKVGTRHAWRSAGSGSVRWLEMGAPQPKPAGAERDTFFARDGRVPLDGRPFDPDDPGGRLLGHFDASQIPPEDARPAGLAKGVFLKWLVDEQLGARHHRLLFIEYQPGASIGLHDHTFEEAYYILSGEVQATLDGRRSLVGAGDVVWTGVGCVHAFANVGTEPVRWLETFSPQPPAENVFRFMAEWDQKGRALEG